MTDLPHLPDLPELPAHPSDVRELVAEHAPELIPTSTAGNRITSHIAAGVLALYLSSMLGFLLMGEAYASNPVTWIVFAIVAAAGAAGTEVIVRRVERRARERFFRRISADPSQVYGAVARRFREDIELQRKRTLGPDSEWGRSRAPLQQALDEANRSAAYWRERLRTDEPGGHAQAQLDTAARLEGRLCEALRQLDARSDALLGFFSRCEAKLAVLEHGKRDLEESRRLAELVERAEGVVAEAELTLDLIGHEFVREAAWVGRALVGLERIQVQHLAGELPAETIESLAERVIESAAEERERLRELLEA